MIDKRTGQGAGVFTMLLKYWIFYPFTFITLLTFPLNIFFFAHTNSGVMDSIEDQLAGVEVTYLTGANDSIIEKVRRLFSSEDDEDTNGKHLL